MVMACSSFSKYMSGTISSIFQPCSCKKIALIQFSPQLHGWRQLDPDPEKPEKKSCDFQFQNSWQAGQHGVIENPGFRLRTL